MAGFVFFALPVKAVAPLGELPQHSIETVDLVSYAEQKSLRAGVSPDVVKTVINCESGWNVTALGDHGHSRGLVQIHDLYHPDVSDEEAYDPIFAIDFLIEKLQLGKGNLWSCYRKFF